MVDIIIKVIEEAESYDLLSLDELKSLIGIPLTDVSEDEQLKMWISQYSDVVATMCNRVFAKEKVLETWRGDLPPYDTQNGRIFLTHYPVEDDDIELVTGPDNAVIDPSTYELENRSGKLQFFNGWSEPIRVTYTGGYKLPEECPPALKHATALLIGGARSAAQRQITSGIRAIVHKESRVQYFDTSGAAKAGNNQGVLSNIGDSVRALLYHYIRINV